jgi:hypothetical protein
MNLNLEELSDKKMISFYLEELKMIDIGQRAKAILPTSVRRRMIRRGFLQIIHNRQGGAEIVLSGLIKKTLSLIEKEDNDSVSSMLK